MESLVPSGIMTLLQGCSVVEDLVYCFGTIAMPELH